MGPESLFLLIALHTGRCILTLGTGPTEYAYWQGSELLGSHSYAVIGTNGTTPSHTLVCLFVY